ncbi:hypothetical protein PC123_g11280 [Phytophthora cactorum]|nr:hypothetical protein PC123_g11280 [Phytophthora cactorum]
MRVQTEQGGARERPAANSEPEPLREMAPVLKGYRWYMRRRNTQSAKYLGSSRIVGGVPGVDSGRPLTGS